MTTPERELNEMRERMARAEGQLRRIKLLLVALLFLVLILLIPPMRTLLGFTLFIAGIVFAVLLFIAIVVQALQWASNGMNHPGATGEQNDSRT